MAEQAMPRLRQRYQEEIVPALMAKFKYTNINQVPKLEKIVLNMGLGDVKDNAKGLEAAVNDMMMIAGQRPVVTKARKSVANFRLREGMNVGAKVTLRSNRMYEFADRLLNIALPRVRDFRGVSEATMRWASRNSSSSRKSSMIRWTKCAVWISYLSPLRKPMRKRVS